MVHTKVNMKITLLLICALILSNAQNKAADTLKVSLKEIIQTESELERLKIYNTGKIDGKLELCSLKIFGAAMNAWIEFSNPIESKRDGNNKSQLETHAIKIGSYKEETNGSNSYRVPVFSLIEVAPETDAEACKIDGILQAYLKTYFQNRTGAKPADTTVQEDASYDPQDHEYDEAPAAASHPSDNDDDKF